jgi:hypothetical protein
MPSTQYEEKGPYGFHYYDRASTDAESLYGLTYSGIESSMPALA